MRNLWLAAAVLLLCTACGDHPELPQAASAPRRTLDTSPFTCKTNSGFEPGLNRDVNLELNDYGRVLADADGGNTVCVDRAAALLEAKLNSTLNAEPNHFKQFLSGYLVGLIFAAADRIEANGGLTPGLDAALQRVDAGYEYTEVGDGGCAVQSGDNCMDDSSGAAEAYGWIAAYRYRRGSPDLAQAQNLARTYIHKSFQDVCLTTDMNYPIRCNGTPLQVGTGAARTVSLNVNFEWQSYGFGLVTGVAAGVLGYEASGGIDALSDDDKYVARGLFAEAQRKIDATVSPNVFRSNCVTIRNDTALMKLDSIGVQDCSGLGGQMYKPGMYALNAFYTQRIGGIPTAPGAYTSSVLDKSLFDEGGFFSWGRYETYGALANDWWINPRARVSRDDNHAPGGFFDGISAAAGTANGWACDPDVPYGSVRVQLDAPGQTPIVSRAEVASEPGVAAACGGGNAHRFSIPLPASWAGLTVTATVRDYLGFRTASLGCGQAGGCRLPSPASVSVAWLKPASVSWGTPNTLTAAGFATNGSGAVQMLWRDVTVGGAWNTVSWQPQPAADGSWSNTVPSSNYCHDFEVQANYSGTTSASYTYHGLTSGYCAEQAQITWIQPQTSAGFGPAGSLVIGGTASGAPAGATVSMRWRNVTTNGPWTTASFAPQPDSTGKWFNAIDNANYAQQYEVSVTYDVLVPGTCTYTGTGAITWC